MAINSLPEIDFVVMWVDPSDPEWQKEKRSYSPNNSYGDAEERYRDWEIFKYWFRGVEKYAPWVRKIHLVTWGHVPEWLDVRTEKLAIVKHSDYMPKEALPTFNSSLIEMYFHKIPDLAEHFVLFNDDMFLTGGVDKDFFFHNGMPRDMLAFQPVVANESNPGMTHIYINNTLMLARHFNKRECVKKNVSGFFHMGYPPLYFWYNLLELTFPRFTGLLSVHTAAPILKSSLTEIWEKEGEALDALKCNRFRSDNDVNHYLVRDWQMLSGRFCPTNLFRHFKYFEMQDNNDKCLGIIRKSSDKAKQKILCINDTGKVSDFDGVKQDFIEAFETAFEKKSSFEL